ncbi:MAG TPA: ABC transporter ATP-binding protein [Candidatus Dadabacteria bacterium]|jgi:ABC-type multidrug transport system ATPase subunit|nr:ABC transporter ATP-binding protein [Candidatus Dadabacteria bacterium]
MKVLLKIASLEKKYNENVVFTSLSFDIPEKSIFWIKGINGSGKSTLMKILSSQIEDYQGDIWYSEKNIKKFDYKIYNEIFYLPTSPNLYDSLSARENIDFFSKIFLSKGLNNRAHLIDAFQVEKHLNKRTNELSDGIKKKISLIISFLINPKVLIFDEPYNYLDASSVESLNRVIKEYNDSGATFVISDNSSLISKLKPNGSLGLEV